MNISIKKYWKIIITALICIVAILFLSYISMVGSISLDTLRNNSIQKKQIIENVKDGIRFRDNRIKIVHDTSLDIANKLSKILYENDPDYDEKLLNEYFSDAGVENLIILDTKRNVQYIKGCKNYSVSKEHFSDAYYDAVFADADTKDSNEINIAALKDYGKDALFIKVKEGYWVYIFPDMGGGNKKDTRYLWEITLENTWVGDYSFVGAMDAATGELIYCWNEALEGEFLEISNNDKYWGKINDELYYITIYTVDDMTVNVVALTPVMKVINMIKDQLLSIAVLIFVAITIMIALIMFLREEEIDAKEEIHFWGKYFLKTQLKKYTIVGLMVSIVLAGSLILVSELENMTNVEEDMGLQIDKTVKLFDDYYEDTIAIGNLVEGKYYAYGRITETFLKRHPAYAEKEGLEYLAGLFGVSDITLFDSEGGTISTSSPLDHLSILSDEDSPLYDLRYVLMGKEEVRVGSDARILPKDISIFAIPKRNEKRVADGIVAIQTVIEDIERLEPRGLLRDQAGVIQFCVDEEGTILIFFDNKMVGKNMSAIGISEDMMYDGYSGKYVYDDKDYAGLVKRSKAGYTVLVSQYNSFAPDVVGTGILSTVFFIIAAIIFAYDGLGSKYRFAGTMPEKEDKKETNKSSDLSTGAKMRKVIDFFVYCFSAYFIIGQWMIHNNIGTHDTIDYIFNGDWERTVNIFSFACNAFIIMIYYSVIRWLDNILTRVAVVSGPSGETICRLAANTIQYLGTIICMYQVVMNFGVDAKTALASIGIAGFGLTFGAQDMIKDVIAGIFIFFEGSFKVGDMLLINGDKYYVRSIGIRTTRVEASGKERVINNSQMSGVVNIRDSSDDE